MLDKSVRVKREELRNKSVSLRELALDGKGGKTIRCDEGIIWIKKGTPFCQNLSDETDADIKRRYINVTAEFLTL